MRILLLGGTSESRSLAAALDRDGEFDVVTSLAGRVHEPLLPLGKSRVGGFGGSAGLAAWIDGEHIEVVVDATHPFADTISANARSACTATGIPFVRLVRPAWTPDDDDDWIDAPALSNAASIVEGTARRAFLTIGRQNVDAFADIEHTWFLIRSIDPPVGAMPSNRELILARGPFDLADEIELMRRHRIDVLVTKNSGGAMTEAKLTAARQLRVPVVMIARPAEEPADYTSSSVADVIAWLRVSP